MSRAFARSEVDAMTPDQIAANLDDINAWVAAGAVDGQAPPEGKKSYSLEELRAMSPEQMADNIDAVNASLGGAA